MAPHSLTLSPEQLRPIVRALIQEYAQYTPSYGEIETEVVMDDAQGHYELLHVGWTADERIHGSVIHIDLRGDKVWLQYDGTNAEIAEELVRAGIPRQQIVLGFRPPELRPYTDFAVA